MNQKLYSIVGYGTFITRGYWKDKKNVEVCNVKNYTRIFPKGCWYPYIIEAKSSSFWALKFDVDEEQLTKLDIYEGVNLNLFKRLEIEVALKNKTIIKAFIYIPTEETIKLHNISIIQDKNDRWKEEIKKLPEILELYPELI